MDTATLRAFVVAADERHMGRAAERLHLSQQAVSKRIARLESTLGIAVFARSGRGVTLTATGETLLPLARSLVADLDGLVATVRPGARRLRVDVLDEHLALLRFVLEYAVDHPETPVDAVMREHGSTIVHTVRTGAADVAFGRAGTVGDPWPDDLVHGIPVLEPFAVLVGVTHPWAGLSELPAHRLREQPLWFPMTGAPPEWQELLDAFVAEFSVTVDYTGSTMGFQHFVDRAAGGDVATFYGAAMRRPPSPGVRLVPIVDPVPVFPWFALWRRGLPAPARAVAEDIVSRARAAVPEPDPGDAWMPDSDRARLGS